MNVRFDPNDRIETHEAIAPDRPALELGLRNNPIVPAQRTWTVQERWHRGSLRACLEAPSDADADRILEVFIRDHLPRTPFDDDSGLLSPFWLQLAIANSWPRTSVWRRGNPRPPRGRVEEAINGALRADLIFELPHFEASEFHKRASLIYFRDCGLLRVLLNKEAAQRRTSEADTLRDGLGSSLTFDSEQWWREKTREFWWEGFVIDAIRTLCGCYAHAFFLRRDNDEIDLVLEWRNGKRWGIEVTLGSPTKKPRDGFFRLADRLALADRFVVGTKGDRRGRQGVPCLNLLQVVERVREGIARC